MNLKNLPEIHIIEAEHMGNPFHIYLLGRDCILDTGVHSVPESVLLPTLAKKGIDPARIAILLITHSDGDHCWGIEPIKRAAPAVTVMAHELEVPWIEDPERQLEEFHAPYKIYLPEIQGDIPRTLRNLAGPKVKVDLALKSGERMKLDSGWDMLVLHLPGHALGHIALYDQAQGCVFIGDALQARGQPLEDGLTFPHYYDVDSYLRTIEALENLDPLRLVFSCHFGVLEAGAITRLIRESRDFVNELDATVEDILAQAKRELNVWEIANVARQRLGSYSMMITALYAVDAHLRRLREKGIAVPTDSERGRGWRLAAHEVLE